jgi:hypothetical protein
MQAVNEDRMKRKRLYLHKVLAATHMLDAKESLLAAYGCTSTLQMTEAALDHLTARVRDIQDMKPFRSGGSYTGSAQKSAVETDPDTKHWRHKCLRMIAACGVNTQDWNAVNAFLLDPRIAGKHLYELTTGELNNLHRKLQNVKANIEKKNDTVNNITQHN